MEMSVLEDINDLRENGWSYNRISRKLNDSGVLSKEGGRWFAGSVRSVYINGVLKKL